jgi:asparagine synthase (glutamine-hydrolysing)
MSLIAGVLDWSRDPASARLPGAMFERFRSCCPDGISTLTRGPCSLSLGQLRVDELAAVASEPIEVGDVSIAVDGRIDRLTEGVSFRDGAHRKRAAAELVAAGYEKWGAGVFSRLRGEFAALIWDNKNQTLLAARDSFGVRPLFYCSVGERLLLASDTEQLLACRLVSSEPDDAMVMDHLLWDFHNLERSFFRDIKRLAPGQYLVAQRTGWRVSSFRVPEIAELRSARREEIFEEFRTVFLRGLEARIRSPYPVVAQLSGGLDSSSIVCAADRLLGEKPDLCPSFVAAAGLFPMLTCDEEPFIRAVERHVRVPVECWDGTRGTVNELEDVSPAMPSGRFSMTAGTEGDFDIARRRGARIVLSGLGGDQIGVCEGGFQDAVSERRWGDAGRMLLGRPRPLTAHSFGQGWRLVKTLTPEWLRDLRGALRAPRPAPTWMLADFALQIPRRGKEVPPAVLQAEIHKRRWLDLTAEWHALAIEYCQHHALRSGLEYRFPFLDQEVVSKVLAIQARLWPPPWGNERLHRSAFEQWLPPEQIRRRSKANFTPALALRVKRHLPAIRDLFWLPGWRSGRYVSQQAAQIVLTEFERTNNPQYYLSYAVWSVATLEAWIHKSLMYSSGRPHQVS